jgi:NAD kinase
VVIARSARSVRLLHPQDYDFFRILREKLHWGRAPDPA